MFHLNQEFSDHVDMTDVTNYPNGKAIDASTDEGVDGTPYVADWRNNIQGFMEALWYRAFGTHSGISRKPDTVFKSDVADAIVKLIDSAIKQLLRQVEVTGYETVVSWENLGISYDALKNYAAIVNPAGYYEEFLPFGAECKNDGLHIYTRRLIDGKIIKGTRLRKWGERKWGVGKWGEFDSMRVNLQFAEVES